MLDVGKASERISALIEQGAHIVDVGGESTAPGRSAVPGEHELERIEAVVAQNATKAFLSIDTYRASTAKRCLELGARMINDVSALRGDTELGAVIAEHKAFVVLMFNKDGPLPHASRTPQEYLDVISEIRNFLEQRIEAAICYGIDTRNILLDPGMGVFISPDAKYSFEVLQRLSELVLHFKEFPMLIGTSRKGFLGGSLAHRDPISQLSALYAVTQGAAVIRTHNVSMAKTFFEIWQKCTKGGGAD